MVLVPWRWRSPSARTPTHPHTHTNTCAVALLTICAYISMRVSVSWFTVRRRCHRRRDALLWNSNASRARECFRVPSCVCVCMGICVSARVCVCVRRGWPISRFAERNFCAMFDGGRAFETCARVGLTQDGRGVHHHH